MEIKEFIERINTHTKAIYENEIDEVLENGRILNWLMGLAGGALLFSFSEFDKIDPANLSLIIIQAVTFVLIIATGLLHRIFTKAHRSYTIAIIRMFDFLRIEFELLPNDIEKELEEEKLDVVFSNYLNGEYFDELDTATFEDLGKKQKRSHRLTITLAIFSILLMIVQFSCFFISIL